MNPQLTSTQKENGLAPNPLLGKRILITRPEGQATVSARILCSRGAKPIEIPLISIEPPPDPARVTKAVQNLSTYDVIAFTSENAVSHFFMEIQPQGCCTDIFNKARIAAIGSGTTSALALEGIRVDILPDVFVGEALAEAILNDPAVQERLPHCRPRVLLLRALKAREVLPQSLRNAGCDVDVVPVYKTQPVAASCRSELISRLEAQTIDCVMLTSSSAANRLADLLGARMIELTQNVVIASIGPITTATARHRGLTVHLEASEHTVTGVITALERYYAMEITN